MQRNMELGQLQAIQLQVYGCSNREWSFSSLYETLLLIYADGEAGLANLQFAVNKVRHEFRQIFFEMGFEEMPTNR